MKLHQDHPAGQNVVTAISDGWIEINRKRHVVSLLLLPQRLDPGWGASGFEALEQGDFAKIAALGCEVLLLGTGRRQRFPPPVLLQPLMQARIGIEVMDTAAACRTYNILVAEGRKVAAALLLD